MHVTKNNRTLKHEEYDINSFKYSTNTYVIFQDIFYMGFIYLFRINYLYF